VVNDWTSGLKMEQDAPRMLPPVVFFDKIDAEMEKVIEAGLLKTGIIENADFKIYGSSFGSAVADLLDFAQSIHD